MNNKLVAKDLRMFSQCSCISYIKENERLLVNNDEKLKNISACSVEIERNLIYNDIITMGLNS